jgi:hypothetical protein
MCDNVRVHIGTPEDMGRRFIDACRRAERGEAAGETNVTFRDLETLLAACLAQVFARPCAGLERHPGKAPGAVPG